MARRKSKKKRAKKKKERVKTIRVKLVPKRLDIFLGGLRLRGHSTKKTFKGLSPIKKILSNEKMRLLRAIKEKKPSSIYELSSLVERDIKSVRADVKLLRKVGFLELKYEKMGKGKKRKRARPLLSLDKLHISIEI